MLRWYFIAMDVLDADDEALSSRGRFAVRDIVQVDKFYIPSSYFYCYVLLRFLAHEWWLPIVEFIKHLISS